MRAEWIEAPAPEATVALERPEWPAWMAPLLARRGITTPAEADAFLAPRVSQLHDADGLPELGEAVELLASAADRGERVAVVGDYDVDGVTATALLTAVFRATGLEVEPILPNRMTEGYGFQVGHVERAHAAGCRVVVTADCGSTSHDAVAAALARGLEVVVTDHHLPGTELPHGALHLNPKLESSSYPFTELSGAGIAFKLADALARRRGREIEPAKLLRIACLGTIADMVPLVGENRVIASVGLAALADTRSPGLRALARVAGIQPPFSATDVGYRLGPRINAAGRLDRADPALELLLTRDRERAEELARRLDDLNRERQDVEARAVEEARRLVLERAELPPILVAASTEWHRGVVGIAAGRLAREFHRPTILLAIEGDQATGSGRSVRGIDLHEFLSGWRAELERFGGHSQAIGVTLASDRLADLKKAWEGEAAAAWDEELLTRSYRYDGSLHAAEVDHDLLELLGRLEPCGAGNPTPLFRFASLRLVRPPRHFGEGHVALRVADDGGDQLDVVGWRWAERLKELPERFEALGKVELDRYTRAPVLRLVDARYS